MPEIKITTIQKVVRAVEVHLPLYRKHDVTPDNAPGSVIYTRVNEDRSAVSIQVREKWRGRPEFELEFEPPDVFASSENQDYLLGLGEYRSNREEFEAALKLLKDALEGI